MNKILYGFVLCLCAISSMLVMPAANAAGKETYTIASDYWFPYNGDVTGTHRGYIVDFIDSALKKQNLNLNYQLRDWDESVQAASMGKVDCIIGANLEDIDETKPKMVHTAKPWGMARDILVTLKESTWVYSQPSDLKQVRLMAPYTEGYSPEVDSYLAKAKAPAVKTVSGRQAFSMAAMHLSTRKADAILENEHVAMANIKKLNMQDRFRVAGFVGPPNALYVACTGNARGKDLIKILDTAWARASADDSIANLLSQYGLNDWNAKPTLVVQKNR
jgi:polar amino acid transport system substrate-binding protein